MITTRGSISMLGVAGAVLVLHATSAHAEPAGDALNLTATSANVVESGTPIKIQVIRWSTDEERMPLVAALKPQAAPPAAAAAATAPAASGRGAARGRAGRGARGGARGGRGDTALDPIAALTAAIGRAPTLGYIWTKDVTGYSIKYAHHTTLPDGTERIVLATDRRLGAYSQAWKPLAPEAAAKATPTSTDYDFTLLEIRLDAVGSGEGKSSLTTKVVADDAAATVALDNYVAAPATLTKVEKFKAQRAK
jgi:hypothetical protein